jgi:hypothetical protein
LPSDLEKSGKVADAYASLAWVREFRAEGRRSVGSNSSFDHHFRNAHIAKDKSAEKRREQICQSSASCSLDL